MSPWSSASKIYGSAWNREDITCLFSDHERTKSWLEILATLAEVQGKYNVIPASDAKVITQTCRSIEVDDQFISELTDGYSVSGHSTVGLIKAVQKRCSGDSGEWFYFGATVQDISDTWMMLVLKTARNIFMSDLDQLDTILSKLSLDHRDTVMAGRTHGQQGLPITFGFKTASWLVEIRRHKTRLVEQADRANIGQLSGGVGSLSSLGPRGLEIQAEFFNRLGLNQPDMSWTVSRDVVAEWCHLMTLISGTADRIGHEIYNLQKSETGELCEGQADGTIGSITMPHKTNPERSEHLGTLSRIVRANTAIIDESLTHDHERDGRSWKLEWHSLPEITISTGKILQLLFDLLDGLIVNPERMRSNLEASDGRILSESIMLALSKKMGKQSAHALVFEIAMKCVDEERSFKKTIMVHPGINEILSNEQLLTLFDYSEQTGLCRELVDRVVGGKNDNS